MKIVVDAMGTDNRPVADVAGAVLAAKEWGEEIILVGDEARVAEELAKHDTTGLNITIVHAEQEILMKEKPQEVVRGKPNSSMHVGLRLVQSGEADAFVSAGNTGATLTIALLSTLKRIKGIKRPALGALFPTPGTPLLIDGGANIDCKPEWLVQFAHMGSIFAERVQGIENPRVGIISNGEEEGKGDLLTRETHALLKETNLNFIGNVEPQDFMQGHVDVAVADGFVGNILMKTSEGLAAVLYKTFKDVILSSDGIDLAAVKPAFDRLTAEISPDHIGGAPLLGVNGVVIVSHGGSSAIAIKQAIGQARISVQNNVVDAIRALGS